MLSFLFGLLLLGVFVCLIIIVLNLLYLIFPPIRFILMILIGVAAYVAWDSYLLAFISAILGGGLIINMTTTKTKEGMKLSCKNCGFEAVDITHEDDECVEYKCPKCGESYTIMK